MNQFILKVLKFILVIAALHMADSTANATIHIIRLRDSTAQFVPQYEGPILVGDTIHWLPYGPPTMTHTITSTNIPANAASFNALWYPPSDTSFQYVPTEAGVYDYVCVPHQSAGMVGSFTVEGSLGTANQNETEGIRLFPNPVLDRIYLTENDGFDEYRIYTASGLLVQSGKQSSNHIPVDGLSRGLYIIELNGIRTHLQKFVKE